MGPMYEPYMGFSMAGFLNLGPGGPLSLQRLALTLMKHTYL